jgi:hypothetical protein
MTVANNYGLVRYVANGSTTAFAVDWRLESADDFVVYKSVDGVQTVVDPSEYTAVNTDTEHKVVFNTAPASGTVIAITRSTPQEQDTPYKTSSGFQAIKVEEDFDGLTMMIQELQQDVDRSVKVKETETITGDELRDAIFEAKDDAEASAALAHDWAVKMDGKVAGEDYSAKYYAQQAADVPYNGVIATGGTTKRTLQNHFGDILNAKDFGAKGDGTTDDTTAINNAAASMNEIDLCGGTVKLSSIPAGVAFSNGYIDYEGKTLNVDGIAKFIDKNIARQRKICTVQGSDEWNPSGSNFRWAQGIAYLNVDGVDKIFVTIEMPNGRTYGTSYGMFKIAEFNLTEDGGVATLVSETNPLPLGHGEGFGAKYDKSTGKIMLISQENDPTRYLANTDNESLGITVVDYKGNSTTPSDCKSYRLRQIKELTNTAFDKIYNKHYIPNITPDGQNLVVLSKGKVSIYDLNEILSVTTVDNPYTWEDAGETIPHSLAEAGYTPPSVRYDATSVKPISEFNIDVAYSYTRQGITCDWKYIYISSGIGNKSTPHMVEVYDYSGNKVDYFNATNEASKYTDEQCGGADGWYLNSWENEGIFVKGDKIYTLTMLTRRDSSLPDIVTYNGKNYLCRVSNTNVIPTDKADDSWIPTTLAATAGTWNNTTAYSTNSATYIEKSANVWCIERYNEDLTQIPLCENGLTTNNTTFYDSQEWNILAGGYFNVNYVDPINGKEDIFFRVTNLAITYKGLNTDEAELQIRLALDDENDIKSTIIRTFSHDGSVGGVIRQYIAESTVRPNWMTFYNGTRAGINIAPSNTRINIGTTATDNALILFNSSESDSGHIWREVGKGLCIGSHSNLYLVKYTGTKTAVDGTTGEEIYTSITPQNSVVLTSAAFEPATDNQSNLGDASAKWKEIFCANATINTSDERLKQDIEDIDERVFRAWEKVDFKQFRFKQAVNEKGENARIHFGLIAQQVKEAFESEGLDGFKYGLLCYDEWGDEYEDIEVTDKPAEYDEDGNEIVPAETHVEKKLVRAAGNAYGIRYGEALALECAYQRWKLEQLEQRLV